MVGLRVLWERVCLLAPFQGLKSMLLIPVLPLAQAGGVIADHVAGRIGVRAQRDAFAPHGQDLPAAAEADFFRGDGHAGQAAALKPMMALFPRGLLFRREKKIGR